MTQGEHLKKKYVPADGSLGKVVDGRGASPEGLIATSTGPAAAVLAPDLSMDWDTEMNGASPNIEYEIRKRVRGAILTRVSCGCCVFWWVSGDRW